MSRTTPESKVKKKIKATLDNYGSAIIWYFMPVPGGYGKPTLDYLGSARGRFFAIEAKAPGEKPTPRQEITIAAMLASGAMVFVIDGDAGIEVLDTWLAEITSVGALSPRGEAFARKGSGRAIPPGEARLRQVRVG
jgi:hypothetical protein